MLRITLRQRSASGSSTRRIFVRRDEKAAIQNCRQCRCRSRFLSTNSYSEQGEEERSPQRPASAYIPPGLDAPVPPKTIAASGFAVIAGEKDLDASAAGTPAADEETNGSLTLTSDSAPAAAKIGPETAPSSVENNSIEGPVPSAENDETLSATEDPETTLRKRTAALAHEHNVPFGSFTPEMWKDAIVILGHWTHVSSLAMTPESLDQSFFLLDRLVLEQEIQKHHELSVRLLNTWLINRLTHNWFHCVRNFHSHSMEDQALLRYEFTPMELLARLEDYSSRSPRLQPNTKTLNLIISGASRCSVPSATGVPGMISPRVATNFAQSLFDQMVAIEQMQQRSGNQDKRPLVRPDAETYLLLIQIFSRNGLATRAEAFLDNMYKKFKVTKDPSVLPTVEAFTTVLVAWSRSGEASAPERAELILQRMQEMSDCGILSVTPDGVTYLVVLHCWSRSAMSRRKKQEIADDNSIDRAFDLFSKMKSLGHNGTKAYNVMMNIFAKAGRVKEAEKLLGEMNEQCAAGNGKVRPGSATYNTLLTAWARSGESDCGDHAETILKEFEDKYKAGIVRDPPDVVTYNTVLLCFCQAKQGDRAKALLDRMKHQEVSGKEIRPDAISYNTTINAYAKERKPREAEALLETMYQDFTQTQGNSNAVRPSVETFSTILTAWMNSEEKSAPERAEAILRTMQDLHDAGVLEVKPNSIAYNIVLSTWHRSWAKDAPERAETLLKEMEDLFHGGDNSVQPDAMAYELVMDAYSRRGRPEEAERILERGHTQSLPIAQGGGGNLNAKSRRATYKKVLGAYKRYPQKDSAERAEALWRRWRDRYESGIVDFAPDNVTIHLLLDAWCHAGKRDSKAAKRAMAFARDIQTQFSSATGKDVALDLEAQEKIREIMRLNDNAGGEGDFQSLCEDYIAGRTQVKPKVSTLNNVIGTLRRKGGRQTCEKVAALLKYVKEHDELGIQPNHATYKIFLNCLEDRPSMWCGHQANTALQEMERLGVNESKRPNSQDYTQVLRIWSKCNDKQAYMYADEIFRTMKDLFDAGHVHYKPTIGSYRAIINIWSASGESNSHQRISELRAQLKKNLLS